MSHIEIKHQCDGCFGGHADKIWAEIKNTTTPQINTIRSNIFISEIKTVEDYISYLSSNKDTSPLNRDEHGYTHAHYAIMAGNIEILEYIISNYDVDIQSSEESTIHLSIDSGNVKMTHFLISKGVNPENRNMNGQNAFIYSCLKNRLLHASYLARLPHININSTDNDGRTGFHYAVMNKSDRLVKELLRYDIDLKKSDKDGMTPLHIAARNGYSSISHMILEKDITTLSCFDSMNNLPSYYAFQGKCSSTENVFTKFEQLRKLPTKLREYRTFIPVLVWAIIAFIAFLFVPLYIKLIMYTGFMITILILINKFNILHTKDSTVKAVVFSLGTIGLLYVNYASYISPVTVPTTLLLLCDSLLIISIYLLHKVSVVNPGIILPNPKDIISLYDDLDRFEVLNSYYCVTCLSIRPERTKHCSLCECCVTRMDHHCPWINNCVGEKNHALFYVFTTFASLSALLMLIIFAYCIIYHPNIMKEEGFFNKLSVLNKEIPSIIEIIILTVFFGSFTSYMTGLHTYFIAKNMTTYEFVHWKRYDYMKDDEGNYYNRYDQGIYNNFMNEFRFLRSSDSESFYKVV